MSLNAFTKARITDRLNEYGWLAEKNDYGWSFSKWNFTGTHQTECMDENLTSIQRQARETILLEGDAFSGKTLKALFDLAFSKELGETERSFIIYAAARTCSVLEEAARQKIDICNIGAGGIFISADYQKIIFLPRGLFETSMQCAGKQVFAEYNGYFVNPSLKNQAAINYTQSVITYYMLTGSYPFNEIDSEKRTWDIIDHNYVPLRNKIWALDERLSFFVDNALQRKSQLISHGEKQGETKRSFSEKVSKTLNEDSSLTNRIHQEIFLSFPLEELYKETGLTSKGEIPAGGHVSEIIRKSTVSPEKFERTASKENINFQNRLAKKRWFRKNRIPLTIVAGIVIVLAAGISAYLSGTRKNPISTGLTSSQTIEMYYGGLNRLDVTAIQGSSYGKGGKNFTELISNVYVAARAKASYNAKEATVAPAEWFCFNYDCNYNIFGVTNLLIDGAKGNPFFRGPKKKTKPKSISSEYGSSMTEGAVKDYTVTYYLVFTEGDDTLVIADETDIVHLLYHKGRWIITNLIPRENSREEISFSGFVDDFKYAWEKANQDPKSAARIMREKYQWIPSDADIDEGQKTTDIARNPFSTEEE